MKKFIRNIFSERIQVEKDGGYALITALIFFLTASAAVIAGISDAVFRETRIVRNEYVSKQSYFVAESGAEDVAYRFKNMDATPWEGLPNSTEIYTIGDGSAIVESTWGGEEISSTGDVQGTKRIVKIASIAGNVVNFPFTLQGGLGGIDLSGGATVQGDIYTTGSIRGCSTCTITGNAVAAGKSTSVLNQDNSSPATPSASITFGTANATQDFAQSFTVSSTLSVTELELFVKKTGNPSNATIRVVTDSGGKPTGSILASGTLSSSLVSTSYDWQNISLTSNPVLTPGTTYWILIDGNTNASNYYTIGANTSYGSGEAKVGRNNSWSSTGQDGYFKVYLGENEDGISGESVWNQFPVSSAYSYEATYVSASGNLYCQIGTDNNKPCDTSRGDPVVEDPPVSNSVINGWKQIVGSNEYSYHEGDYVAEEGSSLYGMKIDGDLIISSGVNVSVAGIVWVTGSVTINGGATVTYSGGDESGVIVADGTISLSGGAQILPSYWGAGQLLLVSTSDSDPAITINGGANDTVVYAPYGGILISGGATVNAAAAEHITATGGSTIIYDPNVSQLNIYSEGSNDPFGIEEWKEIE